MPFTLLHPGLFALGIACVSIPIILHLLKRKRRPIPWGAMRFLEQAYRKRRRILTIEQLILLVLRCVLLALIAMGVGSLMLGSGLRGSIPTTMVIVLDQSIGSALDDGDSTSLEKNKEFALRAIDELDSGRGDQVMLIGAGMPADGIVMPESSDLGAVRSFIESAEATDSGFDLAGALSLAGNTTREPDRATNRVLVIASASRGFHGSRRSTQEIPQRNGFDHVIARSPESGGVENIGIMNAATTRSLVTHSGVTLPMGARVELIRSGAPDQAVQASERTSNIRVLDQENNQIGQRVIRWASGQTSVSVVVAIDPRSISPVGARTALISVQIDEDANKRDNARMIPIPTRSAIRVGVIDENKNRLVFDNGVSSSISSSRWVRAALSPDERFGITIVDIDAARASVMITPNLDAIIVLTPSLLNEAAWNRLDRLNESGALIVITPDALGSSLDWLNRIDSMSPGLIADGSVLRDHERAMAMARDQSLESSSLLMGIASEFDQLARAVSAARSVRLNGGNNSSPTAVFEDGSAFALQSIGPHERGMVVVFASAIDLDWTNLPARPMFVPMMQEIVRQGVGEGSTMPTIKAGGRLPSPAWVITNQRISEIHAGRQATKLDDTSRAGVIAQLDSQGATRSFVVINPATDSARTDPSQVEELEEAILAQVDIDEIEWFDADEQSIGPGDGSARSALLGSSTPGVSIALWLLAGAGIIAAIEFVLAKLFTAKLFDQQARGAHA